MPETLAPDPQLLLAHADWVRALARRLVGDQAEADDLAQDAWVAALRSPPATTLNLRGWLARVVRNAFLQHRRGTLRRLQREAAAAPAEAVPSAADLVERASAHRELVTAVLALAEPYRTTVLLRWFEGLAPRQVALRMAVPVATVRTRLTRAHAELRAALTRERRGEARAWMALLLPGGAWLEPATVAGGVLLVKKVPLVLAACLLLAATVVLWPGVLTPPKSTGRPDPAPRAAPDPGGGNTEPRPDPATAQRQRVADPAPPAPAAPATLTVRGRALREDGTSAVGVAVGWEGPAGSEKVLAVTDGEGRFAFTAPARRGELVAVEPKWATLLAGVVSGASSIEPVVVVAPAIGLSGVVVDPEGGPIADAIVGVPLPENLRARMRAVLDWSADNTARATTDARGRFALPRVAQVADSRLVAQREGFLARDLPLPATTDLELRIVLERPRLMDGAVRGQVVTPDGAPVAGARVALGAASTRTQADGVFELPQGKTGDRLLAVKAGWLPASRQIERDPKRPAEFVILRLSGTPLSIQGRVVDEAGAPLAGMKVWVNDPTVFGLLDDRPAAVENLIAGLKERPDIDRLLASLSPGGDPGKLLDDTPTVLFGFVRSDADGRFELTGLTDRDYTLVAMDAKTLLRTQVGPVHAGSREVQLVLAASQCFARVAGQLVSRTGTPIAEVRIVAMTDTIRLAVPNRGGASTMHAQGVAHAITDDEGRFELRRVPKSAVYLRMDGERILPLEYGRGVPGGIETLSDRAVDDLCIVVGQRVHLRVELTDVASADEAAILDDQGKAVMVNVFEGKGRTTTERAKFRDGKTSVLAVPDAAATLVLYQGGKEVRRSPLNLAVGDLNVVRL